MKLIDLEPVLSRCEERVEPRQMVVGDHETWRDRGCPTQEVIGPVTYHVKVESLADAQQVMFLCPACYVKNGGEIGTHSVIVGR